MDAIFKLFGLGLPFGVAGGIYAFFHWIDTKASRDAKTAIAGWFKPLSYDRAAVASMLVELFDRMYSKQLFSFRAFWRSAIASVTVTIVIVGSYLIVTGETAMLFNALFGRYRNLVLVLLLLPLAANILSDYVSLFFVRYWLLAAGQKPLTALLAGPLVGSVVIITIYFTRHIIFSQVESLMIHNVLSTSIWDTLSRGYELTRDELVGIGTAPFLWGALAVHTWLPLFALGVLVMQALDWFYRATGWMQWFLDGGREHPLQAIGYIAAAIGFVCTALAQWIFR